MKENTIKRENAIKTFTDLTHTSEILSNDISKFLSNEMEELNISSHVFKKGMERYIGRVLNAIFKNPLPVIIFPDSVPGFTLMVFKKIIAEVAQETTIKTKRNPTQELQQANAIDSVVGKFFDKNKQKVLIIENEDIIFALFPIADTKKNLKEMELYITY